MTPDIEAALAEIDSINTWFKEQATVQMDSIKRIRVSGPKASRRHELQVKVRAYLQEKLGPEFIVIGWGGDDVPDRTTFRGDCRARSDSGHERPKRKRRPSDDHDIGGSD